MRKVILSGGNGFIGSSLIHRLLKSGVEVHAIANENHQRLDAILPPECIHVLKDGPGSAVEIITRVKPDTIFHLAAVYAEPVSAKCVLSMIEGNLTLGASLLFAATQCHPHPVFINTGTYWQFDEDSSYSPNTLYAATKHAFQDILQFYRQRLGIASLTLVLYDTFGEEDTRPKLWRKLITSAPGTPIRLSDGSQTIHLIHIDDTVDAFLVAAKLLDEGRILEATYFVPSINPQSLRSLVETLNTVGQLNLDLQWGAMPFWEGQIFSPAVGDILPGWEQRTDVIEALLRMARSNAPSITAVELPLSTSEVQS